MKYRFYTAIPGLRHQLQGGQADIEQHCDLLGTADITDCLIVFSWIKF
jgi:hypothetical protein